MSEVRRVRAFGSRGLEARLLDDLRARLASRDRDPVDRAFDEPVRLVVASSALREHWVERITTAIGPAALGIVVQTFGAAVQEIRRRARRFAAPAGPLFEVAVRRAVAREERPFEELGSFEQGDRLVERSVRELLEAGSWNETTAVDHGRALRSRDHESVRARWLLRVAERVARSLGAQDLAWPGRTLEEAAEVFTQRGFTVYPARHVLLHGFTDGTFGMARLMRAWLVTGKATWYVDHPWDPWFDEPSDAVRHAETFQRTLAPEPDDAPRPDAPPERSRLSYVSASGTDGEVQEIAHRVRVHLVEGAQPERIGIVARDLDRYAPALRKHFATLGVPFRGVDEPRDLAPLDRRQRALRELLQEKDGVLLDRWFDVLVTARPGREVWWEALEDLRLVCRSLGWTTIGELARAEVIDVLGQGNVLKLPSLARRERLEIDEESDEDESRRVGGDTFHEAVRRARRLVQELEHWPVRAPWDLHLARLLDVVRHQLGTVDDPLLTALDALRGRVRPVELDFQEFLLVLERLWESARTVPLGSDGAGCWLLNTARARGMTFEHLFLLGVHQDAYPRTGREDPLLPDRIRRTLHASLPGLPLHGRRRDEERFLFAELLSSAACVTLSWQRSDEDGKLRNPSPFLQRLLLRDGEEERVPRPVVQRLQRIVSAGWPLTAREHLLEAALHGDRDTWARRIEDVFAERAHARPARLSQGRRAILDEFDPDRRTPAGRLVAASPGPYLGFLGTRPRDPDEVVHVTHLESYARCPWQFFLTRGMRLEAPLDPLESLPAIDGRMLGILVHDVLQVAVEGEEGARRVPLSTLRHGATRVVRVPDDERITALLTSHAEEVARDHGLYLVGLQRVLARRARPFVDVALQIDWPNHHASIELLGCEVQSSIALETPDGERRTIACRIDRVDRREGRYTLTDYKTSRPHSSSSNPKRVAEDFQQQFEQGLRLQIVVYAAIELDGAPCRARYLYLRPDNARFEYAVTHRDELVTKDLPRVVTRLLRGRDGGVSFPRLEGANGVEPRTCTWCEVSIACCRSDSGQRARLRRIAERATSLPVGGSSPETTFLPLWDPRREARFTPEGS